MKKLVLLVVAICLGVLVWYLVQTSPNGEAYEYSGYSVKEAGADSFILTGTYIKNDDPDWSEVRNVEITVDGSTRITKIALEYPTKEELERNNGFYQKSKLPKTESQVDFEQLKNDVKFGPSFKIKSPSNVFGKKSFKASEIEYTYVEPPPPPAD